MELRDAILAKPMSAFQWRVVAICIVLTAIDGYDVLVTAYTLPALAPAWGLSEGQVGLVASIGTLGMGLGAAALAPMADRLGRRRHILLCLVVIVIGLTATGLAPGYEFFLVFRFCTGLFLGAIVPSINVLTAEYSNDRRRGTVMGIYGIGFPLGAALGGFLSVPLIDAWSWHGPFFFAAGVTGIMLVWCWFSLPESVSFLVEKRPANAAEEYSRISEKVGLGPDATLPEPTSGGTKPSMGQVILQGVMLRRTLLLWVSYALLLAAFYFANTYTARLVALSTGDDDIGIVAQALVAAGGVLGALSFAALSARVHPRLATAAVMAFGALAFLAFAGFFQSTTLVFILAVAIGLAANGGVAAYMAITPAIYPTAVRVSAIGLMLGFGRTVAFLAPNVGAFMLARGLTASEVYVVFGCLLGLGGLLVHVLHRTYRGVHALDAMELESERALGVPAGRR